MNVPYQVETNLIGEVTNPIDKIYVSAIYPNRKARRAELQKDKFQGMLVTKVGKYLKVRQFINCKNGEIKTIHHYKPMFVPEKSN
jgi:hypothetical protein